MSVHFIESSIIPLSVLGASLFGSGHCVAMCGGLTATISKTPASVLSYHLGRLIGYCGLGALAGYLGELVFRSETFAWVPWLSTILLSACFVFLGVRLWTGRSLHLFHLPAGVWRRFAHVGPGGMGLFSAFLPCGWLHTFILGALATRSAVLGAGYLVLFWAGTLPALTGGPLLAARVFRPIARRAPKLSAIILIAIGMGNLGIKMRPLSHPDSRSEGGSLPVQELHCH